MQIQSLCGKFFKSGLFLDWPGPGHWPKNGPNFIYNFKEKSYNMWIYFKKIG